MKAAAELLAGARLIVRNGRAWLPLTDDDIERGAAAIVADPGYRDEMICAALRHAHDVGDPDDLSTQLLKAYTALQLNDTERTTT